MIEVEIKVPVLNREKIIDELKQTGFVCGDLVRESDLYFDNECGQIKKSDGALRLRSCENLTQQHTKQWMTCKGPKLDEISMTRTEMEMEIGCVNTGEAILKFLGYVHTYPVTKLRQYYFLKEKEISACLDQVEGLGDFLELEQVVKTEEERPEALKNLLSILEKLGFSEESMIRESYLAQLLCREG